MSSCREAFPPYGSGHKKFPLSGKGDAYTGFTMKSIALCALLTPVVAGGGLALWPQAPRASLPSPSLKQAAVVALAAVAATNAPVTPGSPIAADPAQSRNIDLHS